LEFLFEDIFGDCMQMTNSFLRTIFSGVLMILCGYGANAQQPDRGFQAANSYAATGLGAVNLTNGNVVLNIPVASLPAGRGGSPGYSVNLQYNSKLWESHQTSRDDGSPDENGNTRYSVTSLGLSNRGGWRLASEYKLVITDRLYHEAPNVCWLGDPVEHLNYRWKVEMEFPDGSVKQFFPTMTTGTVAVMSDDGYSNVDRNGVGYTATQGTHPATGNCLVTETSGPLTTSGMTYITTDGSRLRLFIPYQSDNWKVYAPNGTVIENIPPTDSTVLQRITDRNGNYVDRKTNGNILDQLGRSIEITSDTNGDSIVSVNGVGGATVSTRIEWGGRWVNQQYRKTTAQNAASTQVFGIVNTPITTVDKIVFPTQLGIQEMTFDYYGDETPPQADDYTEGWGEMKSVTQPTGAKTNYNIEQAGDTAAFVLDRSAGYKELVYDEVYDGGSAIQKTDKTLFDVSKYGGTVTSPNGSISSEGTFYDAGLSAWNNGLAFVSSNPDGSRTERVWAFNNPLTVTGTPTYYSGYGSVNAYVKTEFTTLPSADGTISSTSQTAIKDFKYDKNGNVLEVKEYDWVAYCSVRTGSSCTGSATVIPTGAVLKRKTVNTYYNQAADATDSAANPYSYSDPSSPKLKNVIKSTEIQNGGGTPVSRSEFYYDDPNNKGNLVETRIWDSHKNGTNQPYSSPLTTTNSIASKVLEYDEYGNPKLTEDAKGYLTQITYGAINGYSGLYPTQTISAFETSVARTSTAAYDFYTGLVTTATDVDNNISVVTVYDDLGRPTKVRTAANTPLESWTQTEYDVVARLVIVRSDLETIGDAKKVAIQHYDQLGRVRLSRSIENIASEDPYNETHGIKVQTRYKNDNGANPAASNGSYSLTSNPFRAAISSGASGEPTMGWTISYSNKTGITSTATSYSGSGLPATFGGTNSTTTGTVTTDRDANATTVADQAGKLRRSIMNSLGQLERVDEPNSSNQLGTIASPNQATSYAYDTLNNLTTVNQGAQARSFSYSSLSRLLSATNPESGLIQYVYDNNSNLTRKTDARGVQTDYVYDALNRVTNRNYTAPGGLANYQATPDVTYTYDDVNIANSKGKLTKVTNGFSTTEYTSFDILGRVTRSKQTTDGVVYGTDANPMTYAYNLSGAMIEQKYPSGRVVKNTLDAEGDLAQVQSKKNAAGIFRNYASSFVYTAAGAVSSMKLGNGKFENTQFNSRLQPIQIGLGASASTQNLLKLNYDYGTAQNNGNVLSQTITVPTVGSDPGFTAVQTYTYDSLNRLQQANEKPSGWNEANCTGDPTKCWAQTFLYDRYGNRNFDTALNRTTTIPANCPTEVCNPSIDPSTNKLVGYQFDNSGNTKTDAENRTFIYEAENKQVEVKNSSNATIGQYFCDGDGKRVKKYIPSTGETTIFVNDAAGKLVAEYSTIVASTNDAKIAYLTNDHLGSPRINTDAVGNVTARHDYHPFGEEIATSQRTTGLGYAEDTVRKKFTGYERDAETELDYSQARMYANKLGRFTGADPLYITELRLADPQQINLYCYVRNNPTNLSDPTGLDVALTGKDTDKTLKDVNNRDKAQFKVKLDKNGILEVVDRDKADVNKLNKSERALFDAIVDTENHAVLEGVGQSDLIDFGQFVGNGTNQIDTSDMAKLRTASKTAAGEAISHEIVEAYSSSTGSCKDFRSCHKIASASFPEPIGSENSQDNMAGNPILKTYTEKLEFTKVNVSVKITYKVTTPIPENSFEPSTPANISKIELVTKKESK
jgi:RHS repeat-associated protein